MLSGDCEKYPFKGIDINTNTFLNALKICHKNKISLFTPSSIAAYGFNDPKNRLNVNEYTQQRPETIYGTTKLYIEQLGMYFKSK